MEKHNDKKEDSVFLDKYGLDEDKNVEQNIEEKDGKSKFKSIGYEIFYWIRDLAIIVIIFLFITTFIGEKTRVKGASMEPTIHDGDNIIIEKLSYRFGEPERFDIIVFPYEGNPPVNYIKRIIGLPGDIVVIDNINNQIIINDEVLDEDYGAEPIKVRGNQSYPLVVPEGEYFVLGDNRNDSADSRYKDVGFIKKEEIIGKTWIRIWPLGDFGSVE